MSQSGAVESLGLRQTACGRAHRYASVYAVLTTV